MKKTALAAILTLAVLISAVAGEELVSLARANFHPLYIPYFEEKWTDSPFIYLDSPMNKTYAGNVSMSFTVIASSDWETPQRIRELLSVDYYIDGSFQGSIAANSALSSPFHYSASLTDLQEGSHILIVRTNSTGVQVDMEGRAYIVPGESASVIRQFNVVANPEPTPMAETLILFLSAGIALVATGLLVYLKKRQRKSL